MKKLIIALLIALIAVPCFAQNPNVLTFNKLTNVLPPLKQGVAYSFFDDELNYTSTFEVMKYKDISLEAGYNTKDAIIAALAVDLIDMKEYTTIPILDLLNIDIRLYGGYKRLGYTEGNNEFDFGVGWTIIRIEK